MSDTSRLLHVINAATATTVSAPQSIACAESVTLVCKRSNHSAGSSTFTAEVSVDGTNWIAYNKWVSNTTNTNAQQLTRVTSLVLSSDTTNFLTMSACDGFEFIRITATEATDGTHDAWLYFC